MQFRTRMVTTACPKRTVQRLIKHKKHENDDIMKGLNNEIGLWFLLT